MKRLLFALLLLLLLPEISSAQVFLAPYVLRSSAALAADATLSGGTGSGAPPAALLRVRVANASSFSAAVKVQAPEVAPSSGARLLCTLATLTTNGDYLFSLGGSASSDVSGTCLGVPPGWQLFLDHAAGTADVAVDVYPLVQATADRGAGVGALQPNDRGILMIGDSWIIAQQDEAWAQPGAFRLAQAGFVGRMASAIGSTHGSLGEVHVGLSLTSGNLFGASANFDPVAYVRAHPQITDVVIVVGHNDFAFPACAHGSPFSAGSAASGVCTVAQTIENIEYVMEQLIPLIVGGVHYQMPPGWIGKFQANSDPGAATYQSAIETVNDALVTFCSGKRCYPGAELYNEACRGDAGAPDVSGNLCQANNSVNYGDGAGLTNRLNAPLMFAEDALHQERTGGAATPYRLHASGYGYQILHRVLMATMLADDPGIATRFSGFNAATIDWSSRPGLPSLTIGTVTATSIQVTCGHGAHVNGSSGDDGKCGKAACEYIAWATCVDTALDAVTDAACAGATESALARDIGAAAGAGHYIEDVSYVTQPRDVVILADGGTGVLKGLEASKSYKVVCVAMSPTAISHPAVRTQATP